MQIKLGLYTSLTNSHASEKGLTFPFGFQQWVFFSLHALVLKCTFIFEYSVVIIYVISYVSFVIATMVLKQMYAEELRNEIVVQCKLFAK